MSDKLIVNTTILIVILIASFIFLWKIRFEQKGYKMLFVFYVIFWIPLMLLRPYRGVMQKALDIDLVWLAMGMYGFIGIFIRLFADYINFKYKTRKCFLWIALLVQLVLYIPIIIKPTTATNIIQIIGVGIGASCIGTFQLMFKEQYTRQKTYLSVSLLSIPPLIANFATAPLQSIFASISNNSKFATNPEILKYMWLFAILFIIIGLIFLFYIKEDRTLFNFYVNQNTNKTSNSNINFDFIILSVIGILIMFIKFSNAGGVATLNLKQLSEMSQINTTAFEGYLSTIFSVFQLIAGVLMGTYLIKRINSANIFIIGTMCWTVYAVSVIFITNPIAYFVIHSLNGFAYGILYNLLLAKILNINLKIKKISSMGLYQSILAIGITTANIFSTYLKNNLQLEFQLSNTIINATLVCVIIAVSVLFNLYCYQICYEKNTILNWIQSIKKISYNRSFK